MAGTPLHTHSNTKQDELTCSENAKESDNIIINEAQLILAEKRTSMVAMRTGIAVFALPLTMMGLLVATIQYLRSSMIDIRNPIFCWCANIITVAP